MTTYKIFPAIGVARLGNSEEFYIAPETANGLPINPDGEPFKPSDFRDEQHRMKRQAARFQVYACSENGTQQSVTLADEKISSIRWTVHLANKKACWYEFIPWQGGENGYTSTHPLRNGNVTDKQERKQLIIDPSSRTLTASPSAKETSCEFDRASSPNNSSFPPKKLKPNKEINTLGGLRIDNDGRLLVLGGHGQSGTTANNEHMVSYANNEGWFDDTSDGYVTATITLKDGTEVEAEAAWVLVAPPAYAPQIQNLVTLYDTIFDTMVRKTNWASIDNEHPDPWRDCALSIYKDSMWQKDFKPHFETHILPLLKRGEGYPWVTKVPPKPHVFNYDQLKKEGEEFNGLRQRLLDYLRPAKDKNTLVNSQGCTMMPYLAGDDSIGDKDKTTSKFLYLTDTQYFMLEQWAQGKFTSGEENTPKQQAGDALTQAVLENCVGGGFSPGIEMTWVSRLIEIYQAPFRIRVKKEIGFPLSLGWNPAADGLEPGDVTKFMAQPWQADFNDCAVQNYGDRLLWWWPPQRPMYVYTPNKAVSDIDPKKLMRDLVLDGDIEQVDWTDEDSHLQMVKEWQDLGFIYNASELEENPLFLEVARNKKR
ncbi:LodA/GoxA family CTQ-dependent oxidase [Candidatus Albibeggiatoa sp. nov. NOAA]|uniref:LodA/GoxA family CTQ-dependent oxidase n=1 Tax=Candidatus Albibeggiatoa sp. nov. NOAA TaxID=3162724 RepID=UPI0032F272C2|nr:LodA/GoxA family CTQ-dependent oxidase [Thiotrichaceae bacterium]